MYLAARLFNHSGGSARGESQKMAAIGSFRNIEKRGED